MKLSGKSWTKAMASVKVTGRVVRRHIRGVFDTLTPRTMLGYCQLARMVYLFYHRP
jgi:hypothetical protein